MEAIRTKDKLFLAVTVPLAAVAAYVYFYRADVARRCDALAGECAALVMAEEFPGERMRAEAALKAARAELERERAVPMPKAQVVAEAGESVPVRELAVLEVFRAADLTVVASRDADGEAATPGSRRPAEVLAATGTRPNPVCRVYELRGGYPAMLTALRMLAERRMAVIPERIVMAKAGFWSVTVWM